MVQELVLREGEAEKLKREIRELREKAAALTAERDDLKHRVCRELEAEFIATNRGRKERVLWESDKKDGRMAGYTGNYVRIERPYDASRVGTIEEVTI
jgi:threonylcarbamoyladenosine tRNA methylthiotransferase MtaB